MFFWRRSYRTGKFRRFIEGAGDRHETNSNHLMITRPFIFNLVFVGSQNNLSVSSQPIHLSVTETPYFNCSSLLGIGWLPSCKFDSSIIPTMDVLPSKFVE